MIWDGVNPHRSIATRQFVEQQARWLTLIRGVLSIYTILCGLYIAASLVPELGWPPLGGKLSPW